MTPIATKGLHKNMEAFLMLITKTEGTDKQGTPYNELFGYDNFTDYSKHPQIKRYFKNPATGKQDFSTAAGRYQINFPTYNTIGMKSFYPEDQDRGAIELIKRAGAYGDVINGNWEKALAKTNRVWASLPGSPYKQPTFKLNIVLEFLKKYSGNPVVAIPAIITVAFLFYFLINK